MTEIVPAEASHVAAIAARARPEDVRELWAQGRMTPAECMAHGMAVGEAWTGFANGEPVCMFGVVDGEGLGQGVPWLVGTVDLVRHQRAFLVASRDVVARMADRYFVLLNTVDDRNVAAKRWLRWLGFTLQPPQPTGLDGELFCPFYL